MTGQHITDDATSAGATQGRWRVCAGRSLVETAVLRVEGDRAMNGRIWSVFALYDDRGRRVAIGQNSCQPSQEQLAQWDQEAVEMASRLAAVGLDLNADSYVRWGPVILRSRNHATGESEIGLSVYAVQLDPVSGLITYEDDATLPGAAILYLLQGRTDCTLVSGREVGRGSDGEPLLANVKRVAKLQPVRDGFEVAMLRRPRT